MKTNSNSVYQSAIIANYSDVICLKVFAVPHASI